MAKKSQKAPTEVRGRLRRGERPEEVGNHWVCPHQLLRACVHAKTYVTKVVLDDNGEYSSADWSDIKNFKHAKPVEKVQRYAKELKIQWWTLLDLNRIDKTTERPFLTQSAEIQFGDRIRELIELGKIPRRDDEGNLIDVVHYVWQMQDWVLDAIPITYYQQANAFRSLCFGEDGCLIEVWSEKSYTSWDRIGAMNVLKISPDQYHADLDARRAHAASAFIRLTYNKTPAQKSHRNRVAKRFQIAFKKYRRAEEKILRDGPLADCEIKELVEADFEVRSAVFYRGEPLRTFARHYGRSRAIVGKWRAANLATFESEFKEIVRKNGESLAEVCELVTDEYYDKHHADQATKRTDEIIELIRAKFDALAEDFGHYDPEIPPQETTQTADVGRKE